MASFVRSSKFRHVFGTGYKADKCFTGIKVDAGGDSNCAVSCEFVAYITGQKIFVYPLDKPGRQDGATYLDYKSKALDLQFSPFNDYVLASGHENGDVVVWNIPEGGLGKTKLEPHWVLEGIHTKKVTFVCWHPVAEYVIASGGLDSFITIWDCEQQIDKYIIKTGDGPNSMAWNQDGSLMAITTKESSSHMGLRIVNPRAEGADQIQLHNPECYQGTKVVKCCFLKDGNILTAGATKEATKYLITWKKEDLSMQDSVDAGNASGVLNLMYDDDLNILYTYGKGESMVKYYEFVEEKIHWLSTYSSNISQKGGNFLPKRAVDYKTCEIARFYKLQPTKCEPVTLTCPRKSEQFQKDLFPPCRSGEKGLTAAEWFDGKDALPPRSKFAGDGGAQDSSSLPKRTPSSKPLVKKMAVKRDDRSNGQHDALDGVDIVELLEDVKKLKSTVKKLSKRLTDLEARAKESGECENGGEEEEEEEEE